MLLQQIKQHASRFVWRTLHRVNPSQVQVRLIERRRHPDALFKAGHGFIPPSGAQVEHAEVVQRLWIARTSLQCPLQIFIGPVSVVELREDHSQAVVRLRIFGTDHNRPFQHTARVAPTFLLAIRVAQVLERNQMIGIELERFLEIRNRICGAPFARGQKAEVVPGVGQGVRIAGL